MKAKVNFGLDLNNVLRNISNEQKDGIDYINIAMNGNTELGRRLAQGYTRNFITFLGRTNSVRSFMSAVTVPGYDLNLLSKNRITREDVATIPKTIIDVPNYWALLAYALCEKVRADKELQDMIKQNNIPFTSLGKPIEKPLFNVMISTINVKHDMIKYVAIVNEISKLIKEDKFNNENILDLINKCKSDPEKEIWDGIACADKLTIKSKEESETKEVTE